jgi:uncharacterized protein (TIGR03083 family)
VSDRFARSLEALSGESAAAEAVLQALPDAAFDRPTRCAAWDVRGLTGHMLRDVDRILDYVAVPAPSEADATGASYFTRYDPVADAPDVAKRSIDRAAAFATTGELVEAFGATWRRAVDLARAEGSDRLVQVAWGPTMRLDDYLDTRVLEMAVHGLDLADALNEPPWLTPPGGAVVRDILTTLLGGAPPHVWDDVELADKGTGRAALTERDMAELGEAADRFPLLA